ncbi:hypothetical protein U1Q18_017309 [Sarracenia purpurea var. burkii]
MESLSSSSSGTSKKAKAPCNSSHIVSCLVDGCNWDLSQCREYHRRHKVCELHSKTPKVTIGGREQRFCQQCSRFHSLIEFDEGKRSCRKRLDGHNRRRRKPQSDSSSRNTGRFLSNQQGNTLLSFGGAQLLPSSIMNSSWVRAVKAENVGGADPYNSHQQLDYIDRNGHFLGSFAHSFSGVNHFKNLQCNDLNLSEASFCQPLLGSNSASGNFTQIHKMLSDGLNRVIDSDCALSLLSSAPAENREIGLSHMVPQDPVPSAQSLVHNTNFCDLSQYSHGIESKPIVSIFNSLLGDNADLLHCQGMFQNGTDGSSAASGSHQTLSFRWE